MSGSAPDLLDRARAAVDAAQHQPADALAGALSVLECDDPALASRAEIIATASWAAGLAARELNDLESGERYLRDAVALAASAGISDVVVGARTSLALALAYLGRPNDGLAELDLAQPIASGVLLARLHMQRALIQQRLGRLDEAIAGYSLALPGIVAAEDRLAEVRLRVNRAIARTYRNQLSAADQDLVRARALALELGQAMQVAACSHNLGFLHGRRGDVAKSLLWFDRAKADYADLGVDSGLSAVLLVDRAEVLLDAGLAAEALDCTRRAGELLQTTGNSIDLAEAHLLTARAATAADDHRLALDQAVRAAELFGLQERPAWRTLAHFVALTAREALRATDELPTVEDVDAAAGIADDLATAGWSLESLNARGLAGRLAVAAGDSARAGAEFAVAARARRSGSAIYRVGGWHAEAQRRVLLDDRRGARRAARTGLGLIERHRASLGAADLRAYVAGHGDQLAELLTTLALERGRPSDVLLAAETWRAGAVSIPVRPPSDPELAARLSALRAAAAERRSGGGDAIEARLAALETEIRDLVRTRSVMDAPSGEADFSLRRIGDALGDRLLVEWLIHRGELYTLWISAGRVGCARVGTVDAVLPHIATVRMSLNRLARAMGSPRGLASARAALDAATQALSELLFGPVRALLADRELVLIPTGPLHRLPWSALDRVRQVPYVIAPSLRTWLAASERPVRRDRLLLVAGPDLPGAAAEVDTLARRHHGAAVLRAGEATVAAVLQALAEVDVAHIAAHGRFRTDNPQFSSLQMNDGELTVYDLEMLPAVPSVLVFSACDAAGTQVRPGDELLGLSASLLTMRATSVIAPSVPVGDEITSALMLDVEDRLQVGATAPTALWAAMQQAQDTDDPPVVAATRSFVALGA